MKSDFFDKLSFTVDPTELSAGKILISEPFLSDSNFSRSVVLLLNYSIEEGAFGVIINKPMSVDMTKMLSDFPLEGFDFHYGGPVGEESLIFVYEDHLQIPEAQSANGEVKWSGDFNSIKDQITCGVISPQMIRFYGGYSGWSPGQLEAELAKKSWIISQVNSSLIFDSKPDQMWRKALKPMGRKYSVMAEFPENPEWN